jgi:hypothetical protein
MIPISDEAKAPQAEPTSPTSQVDVFPLGKFKRFLLALADYFITYILAFFLFTAGSYPAAMAIGNSAGLQEEANANTTAEINLLLDSNLLETKSRANGTLAENLDYSQELFLISSLKDETENNPFYHYDVVILGGSIETLRSDYGRYDAGKFFSSEVSPKGFYVLNEPYLTDFKPLLDNRNSLSSTAQTEYDNFTNHFFLSFYGSLIQRIESQEGLSGDSPLLAYRGLAERNIAIKASLDRILIYACYSAYLLAWAVLFVLIPLVSKRGKTLGLMALREDRVGDDNLAILPKGERAMASVYSLVLCLSFVPLLPLAYLSVISNLFSIFALNVVALISLGFDGISLIMLIAGKYNKDLLDFLSRSVVIDDESFDEVEKARQYGR